MNIINRIIVVIAIIGAIIGITLICLFPDFFVSQAMLVAESLDRLMSERVQLVDRLTLIAVAAIFDAALLLMLVFELRRPRERVVQVQDIDGGMATLTADSIRKRLAFYIDGLEDVVNVKPQVSIKRDTVSVAVDVQTSATVSVPTKVRQIVEIIHMVVTETMGLKLRDEPRIHVRTGSYKDVTVPTPEKMLPVAPAIAEPSVPTVQAPAQDEIILDSASPAVEEE